MLVIIEPVHYLMLLKVYYKLTLEITDWIVEYLDADGNGLPDAWEAEGIDFDVDGSMDVDFPAMTVDPNLPGIFVYYDWMYKAPVRPVFEIPFGEKNTKPAPATLDAVVSQFRNHGIRLHIIKGRAIPFEDVFELWHLYSNWNRTAAEYFPRQHWNFARYCLLVNKINDDRTFRVSLDIEGSGSTDIFIPVKKSLSAGDYAVECTLTFANNMRNDVTHTVHVLGSNHLVVEVGENLNVDDASFGGYAPVIDDSSIKELNGTVIHGVKAGQTFIVIKDG